MPSSIRRQLYGSLLGILLPLFLVAGIAGYLFVNESLTRQFDSNLQSKARVLAAMVEPEGPELKFEFEASFMPEFARNHEPEYFQLWELKEDGSVGKTLGKSLSLKESTLPARTRIKRVASDDFRLPDGRRGRIVWLKLRVVDESSALQRQLPTATQTSNRPFVLAAVAKESEAVDNPLKTVLIAIISTFIGLCIATLLIVHMAVQKTIQPIEDLGKSVRDLDPSDTNHSYRAPEIPIELRSIASGVSDLSERIKQTILRERRFTSAAAHEFRTPLAETRSLLDVRIKWPEDVETCVQTMTEVRAINQRVEKLTAALLDLARAESRTLPVDKDSVRIDRYVEASLKRVDATALARHLHLDLKSLLHAQVSVHLTSLDIIWTNLIDNAVSHAPVGSTVTIATEIHEADLILSISNPAPSLSGGDLANLFEPFWRSDSARTASDETTAHLGLGLSIATAISVRSSIPIRTSLVDGILTFALTFPIHLPAL